MAIFCGAAGAYAEDKEPLLLGEFGDWSAYSYKAIDTKVCYVSSRPKASEPKAAKRDPIFFLVTHMPGRSVRDEVSTIIGYPFKQESSVQLAIDEAKFEMRTNADGAWAEDAATDRKIVATMKGGKAMTLQGTSWRGTVTTDTYSLKGLSAAMAKIDQACK